MDHELQHSTPAKVQVDRELAATYARVFMGDEDGKRVLADLKRHFGVGREVFTRGDGGRFDTIAAAKTDGQRDVLRHIWAALIVAGSPGIPPA